MLLADYDSYIKSQEQVSATYAVSIVISAFSLCWSSYLVLHVVLSLRGSVWFSEIHIKSPFPKCRKY